jgi:hypothetical protein
VPVLVNVVDMGGTPSVDANCTPIDKVAAPVPDAGDTVNHGTLAAAVQVTAFWVPVCVKRTNCAGVWDVSAVAVGMAAKFSAGRSIAIVGLELEGYTVFKPSRSSGPNAGGVGIVEEQHDEFMMFTVGLTSLCPKPMAWPISCASTRVKFTV